MSWNVKQGDVIYVLQYRGRAKWSRKEAKVIDIKPRFMTVDYGMYRGTVDIFDVQRKKVKIRLKERIEVENKMPAKANVAVSTVGECGSDHAESNGLLMSPRVAALYAAPLEELKSKSISELMVKYGVKKSDVIGVLEAVGMLMPAGINEKPRRTKEALEADLKSGMSIDEMTEKYQVGKGIISANLARYGLIEGKPKKAKEGKKTVVMAAKPPIVLISKEEEFKGVYTGLAYRIDTDNTLHFLKSATMPSLDTKVLKDLIAELTGILAHMEENAK